jgi:hypothetical protein
MNGDAIAKHRLAPIMIGGWDAFRRQFSFSGESMSFLIESISYAGDR